MQPAQDSKRKLLGEVTAPSGKVLLIDFGIMDLWTHDKPPLINSGILSEEALKSANNGADFKIEGVDAFEAGRKFDRQPNPLYLYDIPRHGVVEILEAFRSEVQAAGFLAKLVELPQRVPPRTRVDQALINGEIAAEIFLHGIHAIAISGLPTDRALRVEGRLMGDGDYAEHWREIMLVLLPEAEIASSKKVGHVAVDMARLMFCDLEAAGKWQHLESIDGLADFVFWGKDAMRLVNKFDAPHLEGAIYGFVDKPINELAELALEVQEHVELHHIVAATDFRPHSDHWRMLRNISQHENEAGEIELGASRCCGFMTSWGDGFFPVYVDLDENGSLIQIRVELGTDETLAGMRMVNRFS